MIGLQAELGGTSALQSIEDQHKSRLNIIKTALDAEVMTVEEAERAKQMIRTQYAHDMLGALANDSKAAFGEQSRAYRVLFAMQKGVAIAQASTALWQNVSQAMSKGWPANIPLIAQAMSQGMSIIANIKQIRSPIVGQAHDGIMSVPKSGTWNLEKGERVLPQHTAKALDDKLDSMGSSRAVNVTVHNYSGEPTKVETDANGDISLIVGQELAKQLPQHVNNPNSEFNKSLKNNYQLQRRL